MENESVPSSSHQQDDSINPEVLAELERCAACNLRATARAVTNYFDKAFSSIGLRVTQTSILAGIARLQPTTVGELAAALQIDHSTLVRNLKRLKELNLFTSGKGEDRRTRTLSLTEKGEKKVLETIPLWREAQGKIERDVGGDWDKHLEFLRELRESVTHL